MNQLVPAIPAMTVSDVEKIASAIAKGGLFGSKDPYAVLTLCLLAQAEGQHPAVVFRDYHIISGKPAKKAEAMLRDFINSGGKVEWHRLDDDCADATFTHPAGSARIEWDTARVKKAQLGGNAMHNKYPRQMLRSRVISEGVRTVYPGATSGLYVPEEVSSFEPASEPIADRETGEIIDARPANGARGKGDDAPFPPGPGRNKTDLKVKGRDAWRDVEAAGDPDEFAAVMATNAELFAQIEAALPLWWGGGARESGEPFEGLGKVIERRRRDFEQIEAAGDWKNNPLHAG